MNEQSSVFINTHTFVHTTRVVSRCSQLSAATKRDPSWFHLDTPLRCRLSFIQQTPFVRDAYFKCKTHPDTRTYAHRGRPQSWVTLAVRKHKYVDMGESFSGLFFGGGYFIVFPVFGICIGFNLYSIITEEEEGNNQHSGSPSRMLKRLEAQSTIACVLLLFSPSTTFPYLRSARSGKSEYRGAGGGGQHNDMIS